MNDQTILDELKKLAARLSEQDERINRIERTLSLSKKEEQRTQPSRLRQFPKKKKALIGQLLNYTLVNTLFKLLV